jgi:hypothetical protein
MSKKIINAAVPRRSPATARVGNSGNPGNPGNPWKSQSSENLENLQTAGGCSSAVLGYSTIIKNYAVDDH